MPIVALVPLQGEGNSDILVDLLSALPCVMHFEHCGSKQNDHYVAEKLAPGLWAAEKSFKLFTRLLELCFERFHLTINVLQFFSPRIKVSFAHGRGYSTEP